MEIEQEHIAYNKPLRIAILVLIILGSLLALKGLFTNGSLSKKEATVPSISVTGKGEIYASPDVAMVTFSVMKEAKTVAEAQTQVNEVITDVQNGLKGKGIAEKDIKTQYYNSNPVYDYPQSSPCSSYSCPPTRQPVLRGYQVSQGIEVKIRKTDTSGEIVTFLGTKNVTNISGVEFSIDDIEAQKAKAREAAIAAAKAKADVLADQLGVKLVRIVNFNEDSSPSYPIQQYNSMGKGAADSAVPAPATLPQGENKITSNVVITYEIR